MINQEENKLIDNILSGNKNDYAILVNRYKDYVFTLAFRILKNEQDAEEAAQVAFIKAFNNLKKFKKESKFSSWLYRIVYNEAINIIRTLKKSESFQIDKFENAHIYHEDQIEKKEKKYFIESAINDLDVNDRAVITLFYLKEMNIAEVGAVLGLHQENVKIRLFRARKKMAKWLKKNLKEESLLY